MYLWGKVRKLWPNSCAALSELPVGQGIEDTGMSLGRNHHLAAILLSHCVTKILVTMADAMVTWLMLRQCSSVLEMG